MRAKKQEKNECHMSNMRGKLIEVDVNEDKEEEKKEFLLFVTETRKNMIGILIKILMTITKFVLSVSN